MDIEGRSMAAEENNSSDNVWTTKWEQGSWMGEPNCGNSITRHHTKKASPSTTCTPLGPTLQLHGRLQDVYGSMKNSLFKLGLLKANVFKLFYCLIRWACVPFEALSSHLNWPLHTPTHTNSCTHNAFANLDGYNVPTGSQNYQVHLCIGYPHY